ncbi:MAG: Holliday junction branch migration protein RuvA [Candidatus Magasanikbacteria bacterium]|jgi:holliday junction DNA helicase RuvA|nr:Holliday junction branch migration protein RuvA [Candidatus Magasanikbacteria bacterium]MBT4315193.1 Holliday junction branch migration protein RuvA [Candidatus Magasanikbacteria bacterium]MBT4547350.1 Holliday junction branch migration protein RuvA [Candidatus Magasanikbacteria bacterium]MBT6819048.1 Holliday junction branch migration protein RuvA [Candidatus Magasanikbacteria bacterium]
MISFIQGKIITKKENSLTVLTAGWVGYEVGLQTEKCASLEVGNEVGLHTYLRVSENAMDLYGFETLEEKDFFELLISVNGIGPKSALNILGLGSLDEIQNAISNSDVDYLTKVSGVGKRTAERLTVELKSKVEVQKSKVVEKAGSVMGDAIDGLVSLGYSKEEARQVVKDLDVEGKTGEQLLREALKGAGK